MPNYSQRKQIKSPMKKISAVMHEFKMDKLHSGKPGPGKGKLVKGKKQAIAIALSEARKAGAKIPKKGRYVAITRGKKV